ncbi:MAG: hypothetical protein J6X18_10730 [Bacteroidales bacterium]|nr:hypothetical protein [Bacteroidales bacterium]
MKKVIRLTESDFRRTLQRAVKQTLNEMEGMSYRQMRNVLGIEDDDELNAAVEDEDVETLEWDIAKEICNRLGNGARNLYDGTMYSFKDVSDLLKEFGFRYVGADDENECHTFTNGKYKLEIVPQVYYSGLGKFTFRNFHIW